MNEGALCSRMPPRCVSSRATNERLSLRNSIEHTVSSSSSSRTGRTVGTGLTAFGLAAFAARLADFPFGLAAFRGFRRAAFRAGFFGLRATAPYLPTALRLSGAITYVGAPTEEPDG